MTLVIETADLAAADVQALIRLHQSGMLDTSPPEFSFALDLTGLQSPDIEVFAARIDGALAGVGALKRLGDGTGEVKSMRTDPAFLRRGVGAALLEHVIARARRLGLSRLSLETGTGEAFEAATTLYLRRGFVEGAPFADYAPSDFNRFFHLEIGQGPGAAAPSPP